MTGVDLVEAALADRPNLKVLFTSGYADPSVARLGHKAGALLPKPYTAEELADKLREVLNEEGAARWCIPRNRKGFPAALRTGSRAERGMLRLRGA